MLSTRILNISQHTIDFALTFCFQIFIKPLTYLGTNDVSRISMTSSNFCSMFVLNNPRIIDWIQGQILNVSVNAWRYNINLLKLICDYFITETYALNQRMIHCFAADCASIYGVFMQIGLQFVKKNLMEKNVCRQYSFNALTPKAFRQNKKLDNDSETDVGCK